MVQVKRYWQPLNFIFMELNLVRQDSSQMFVFLAANFTFKEDGTYPNPPSYNVATTLPSYDEAERTKAEAALPLVTGRVWISQAVFVIQHKDALVSLSLESSEIMFHM